MSDEPVRVYDRGEEFKELCRIAKAWREKHTTETGHSVWLHARGMQDFALACFTCLDMGLVT